jgi:hypothetical protein
MTGKWLGACHNKGINFGEPRNEDNDDCGGCGVGLPAFRVRSGEG